MDPLKKPVPSGLGRPVKQQGLTHACWLESARQLDQPTTLWNRVKQKTRACSEPTLRVLSDVLLQQVARPSQTTVGTGGFLIPCQSHASNTDGQHQQAPLKLIGYSCQLSHTSLRFLRCNKMSLPGYSGRREPPPGDALRRRSCNSQYSSPMICLWKIGMQRCMAYQPFGLRLPCWVLKTFAKLLAMIFTSWGRSIGL